MNLLFYSGLYKKCGVGNLLRMYRLYTYLINYPGFNIKFITNNTALAKEVLSSRNKQPVFYDCCHNDEELYDTLIIDSPSDELDLISFYRNRVLKIIALDYFNYENNEIDIIINLFSHNYENKKSFLNRIYEGEKYAIVDDICHERIKNNCSGKSEDKISVLITFGGEDPESNTMIILDRIMVYNNLIVKVIVGPKNKDRNEILNTWGEHSSIKIYDFVENFSEMIFSSDFVICGGGTTLLETICMGKPAIAIGQNQREIDFINNIKTKIKIFRIDEVEDLFVVLKNVKKLELLCKSYCDLIDGYGKERIRSIIIGKKNG